MPSTIIALMLSAWASSYVNRKYKFVVFSIGSIFLLIPVRYVVFPVTEYLKTLSAQQFFTDLAFMIKSCFSAALNVMNGNFSHLNLAIPGILFVIGFVTLIFSIVKNVSSHKV